MNGPVRVALIIPARNEELSLPTVLARVPAPVTRVVVVDNGSTDATAAVARSCGAQVVHEPVAGYGRACLAGISALTHDPPALVAFADADGSDGVENLAVLLQPILAGEADLSLALRVPDGGGALTPQQRFGNRLATRLIRFIWGHDYGDLGPMRVVTWQALLELGMEDLDFGWTVEMQIRAVKAGLRIRETPLPYHPRLAGESKISRTLSGVVRAGAKILWVIGRELWRAERSAAQGERDSGGHRAEPASNPTEQPCRHRRQEQGCGHPWVLDPLAQDEIGDLDPVGEKDRPAEHDPGRAGGKGEQGGQGQGIPGLERGGEEQEGQGDVVTGREGRAA